MIDRSPFPRRATPTACENLNHLRSEAMVGHCPDCGAVVNPARRQQSCTAAAHDDARRRQSRFCSHCGTALMTAN